MTSHDTLPRGSAGTDAYFYSDVVLIGGTLPRLR